MGIQAFIVYSQEMVRYMLLRILLLSFICFSGSLKSQKLSSVFIDSLKITVGRKVMYESKVTVLKFVPNYKSSALTVYDDGNYKLDLNFELNHFIYLNTLSPSGVTFYHHDSAMALFSEGTMNAEECSGSIIEQFTLKNWVKNEPARGDSIQLKIGYRYVILAPADTSNYRYHTREGLWMGPYFDALVVLNYVNDKKDGPAKTVYDNGDSYHVNFTENALENYGMGKYEYAQNGKYKHSYVMPKIITQSCDSAAFIFQTFSFEKGKKIKEINKYNDLSVHFQKKGLLHDSIQFEARGNFMAMTRDTMIIESDEIEIHDFYKAASHPLHSFYKSTGQNIVKIPIKDIDRVYYARDKWKRVTMVSALLSFVSAAVVSPLVSIEKGKFNTERFGKVSLTSLGAMTLSISLGIGFSQKQYILLTDNKKKAVWKLKYDAYE